MARILPLTEVLGPANGTPPAHRYTVTCRDCGVVSDKPGVTVVMAGLYRQRHLAEHLAALSAEITQAAR
jgi:hypothetical protein